MDRNVLIDALYINNGGGKILLDYLINELERTNLKIFYLLDSRVEGHIPSIDEKKNNVFFMEASLIKRLQFYNEHIIEFSKVLCFGNLPPNIRINAHVYTYFHQPLFLEIPSNLNLREKVKYRAKMLVLRRLSQKTNFWIVQSRTIKRRLSAKYNIRKKYIKVLPFYPGFQNSEIVRTFKRVPNSYIYVSNAPVHKNHIILINAFCEFYDKQGLGKLTLTVSDHFPELLQLISEKQNLNYPIVNIGFVPRENLSQLYHESEYLIYPSLAESFGLGLVEAIENGCKIIGADLPYTFAVCEPSLTFDPLDLSSISSALTMSLGKDVKDSKALVSNKIGELIDLLR